MRLSLFLCLFFLYFTLSHPWTLASALAQAEPAKNMIDPSFFEALHMFSTFYRVLPRFFPSCLQFLDVFGFVLHHNGFTAPRFHTNIFYTRKFCTNKHLHHHTFAPTNFCTEVSHQKCTNIFVTTSVHTTVVLHFLPWHTFTPIRFLHQKGFPFFHTKQATRLTIDPCTSPLGNPEV